MSGLPVWKNPAERDEILLSAVRDYAKVRMSGRPFTAVYANLRKRKIPVANANFALRLSATVYDVTQRIKNGEDRAALVDRRSPPDLHDTFHAMIDAIFETCPSMDPPLVDKETLSFASRPALIQMEFFTWLRHELLVIVILTGIFLIPAAVCGVLAAYHHLGWAVPAIMLVALYIGLQYLAVKSNYRIFRFGLLAPGVVTSVDPVCVGVLVNMGHGGLRDNTETYVVKISDASLSSDEARLLGVGGNVPVICGFTSGDDPNRWKDVTATAVHSGTSIPAFWEEASLRIPLEEWSDLDESVARLTPEQFKQAGLYPVPIPTYEAAYVKKKSVNA